QRAPRRRELLRCGGKVAGAEATRWTCEAHPRRLRRRDLLCQRAWGAKTQSRDTPNILRDPIYGNDSHSRKKPRRGAPRRLTVFAPRLFQKSIRLLKASA